MRILADENVHMEIVVGLRKQGFDLLTAAEAGLVGRKDQEILGYAEEHDLLVLSGDKDFGGLLEFGKMWGSGRVLLLRYQILILKRSSEILPKCSAVKARPSE